MTISEEEITQSEGVAQDDLELARKLAAAYIAHHGGYKSIDYARKCYVDSSTTIGPEWIELARFVKTKIHRSLEMREVPLITTRTQ